MKKAKFLLAAAVAMVSVYAHAAYYSEVYVPHQGWNGYPDGNCSSTSWNEGGVTWTTYYNMAQGSSISLIGSDGVSVRTFHCDTGWVSVESPEYGYFG
jgi:hypothetical protein